MNRKIAYLSITILMTATSYCMYDQRSKGYEGSSYGGQAVEREVVAIKDMDRLDLDNYEVTLPEQSVVEQRINGLNLPATFFGIQFDKEKLITNIAQLNRVSTIGKIHMQITLPFVEPLIEKWKNPVLSFRVPTCQTKERQDEDYQKHLRPHCLKVLKVLLQDHPEHEVLMAQIDKLRLI